MKNISNSILAAAYVIFGVYILLFLILGAKFFAQDGFSYMYGDFWFTGFIANHVDHAGWYPTIGPIMDYGVPYGFNSADFPGADSFHVLGFKIISLFVHNWLWIVKLYYLSSFALCAILAYAVFRNIGIARLLAFLAAIVFTFLPYHFLRTSHLFLAAYHTIPLCFWSIVIVWRGFPSPTRFFRRLQYLLFILGQCIIASSGVYYAFFSCYLYVVTIVIMLFRGPERKKIAMLCYAVAIIFALSIVQIIPSKLQNKEYGANVSVPVRHFEETETSGLKLTQMLLPTEQSRIKELRDLEQKYASSAPLVNENRTVALGVIGGIGFLLSLVYLLAKLSSGKLKANREQLESTLTGKLECHVGKSAIFGFFANILQNDFVLLFSLYNLACFLYGTVGGLGTFFSFFAIPEIRGVNRISVFIAFGSIGFAYLLIQNLFVLLKTAKAKNVFMICASILTLAGLYLQIPIYGYADAENTLRKDRAFFAQVTDMLPGNSAVFQLPYHPFPEGGSSRNFEDYTMLKGNLFAPGLRWSTPVFRGRDGDIWYRYVSSQSVEKMIDILKKYGFSAIYLDRNGYPDGANSIMTSLAGILGEPSLVEPGGSRMLFKINGQGEVETPAAVCQIFTLLPGLAVDKNGEYQCNIDMFQDGQAGLEMRVSKGDRIILAGWLAAPGKDSKNDIYICLIKDNERFCAKAFSGMRRDDVQNALKANDTHGGFMLYASTKELPKGKYDIYIKYKEGDALVTIKTRRYLIVK